jgi:hypothetical protein
VWILQHPTYCRSNRILKVALFSGVSNYCRMELLQLMTNILFSEKLTKFAQILGILKNTLKPSFVQNYLFKDVPANKLPCLE